MERAETVKVRKWDEINGEQEKIYAETPDAKAYEETAGAGLSISRNPMRGIEDMVEQNDNSFDGVINNVKQEYEQEKEDKNSIMEKIKEQKKQAAKAETAEHILKTKQCCHCREMGEK